MLLLLLRKNPKPFATNANLVDYSELEIAKVIARHSVEPDDRPAKALRPESRGPGGQDARRWNQGQENLIDESCLDCEILFTAILEKCADADFLQKPRYKN